MTHPKAYPYRRHLLLPVHSTLELRSVPSANRRVEWLVDDHGTIVANVTEQRVVVDVVKSEDIGADYYAERVLQSSMDVLQAAHVSARVRCVDSVHLQFRRGWVVGFV